MLLGVETSDSSTMVKERFMSGVHVGTQKYLHVLIKLVKAWFETSFLEVTY